MVKKHSLAVQILSVFLALVLVIAACPFRTAAAEAADAAMILRYVVKLIPSFEAEHQN